MLESVSSKMIAPYPNTIFLSVLDYIEKLSISILCCICIDYLEVKTCGTADIMSSRKQHGFFFSSSSITVCSWTWPCVGVEGVYGVLIHSEIAAAGQ